MSDAAWEIVPQCRCCPVKLPLTECLCALWVLIAAWNFPSEVILLEHELLTIPEDKQEHAQSEL